jgi:hypothetical protein
VKVEDAKIEVHDEVLESKESLMMKIVLLKSQNVV